MNRPSKDIDTVDNTVPETLQTFLTTPANTTGPPVLIATTIPQFLAAVAVIAAVCHTLALHYRASARELKRSDAIPQLPLCAHFSESLTGLAAIRAYGETGWFRKESEDRVNIENRFI